MESGMILETGIHSALLAAFIVILLSAGQVTASGDFGSAGLFASRHAGMEVIPASTFMASVIVSSVCFLISTDSTFAVVSAISGKSCLAAAMAVSTAIAIACLAKLARPGRLDRAAMAIMVAAAAWPVVAACMTKETGTEAGFFLKAGLISSVPGVILFASVCVFTQSAAPGIGGIALSAALFLAGNMKGFMHHEQAQGAAGGLLSAALAVIPNFQTATLRQAEDSIAVNAIESTAYALLFAAGMLFLSVILIRRRAVLTA